MEINFKDVKHIYQPGNPFEFIALDNINIKFEKNKYYAIIGHTGSGKSTLIQHINALLKPTDGVVTVGEYEIKQNAKKSNLKKMRKNIGFVFQFPEHQLFEENILKDVMFGPLNFGVSKDEAEINAKEALKLVGLDSTYYNRSPFELSGGQMRRVAIAGILAMNPDILVLDEPTAGLDPRGQKELMALFKELQTKHNKTIILVSHYMDDIAAYAEYIYVLEKGEIYMEGTKEEVFSDIEKIKKVGLDVPSVNNLVHKLNKQLDNKIDNCFTIEDFVSKVEERINVK